MRALLELGDQTETGDHDDADEEENKEPGPAVDYLNLGQFCSFLGRHRYLLLFFVFVRGLGFFSGFSFLSFFLFDFLSFLRLFHLLYFRRSLLRNSGFGTTIF